MIIAIDGPAASGKGTLAKLLAHEFQLQLSDSGKLYRLVAWQLHEKQIDCSQLYNDEGKRIIQEICMNITTQALQSPQLQTENVGKMASKIASIDFLRELLIPIQRELAHNLPEGKKGLVMDGRDIGTVIFPDADYKFFLVADLSTRVERRWQELKQQISRQQITHMIQSRDAEDRQRALAPLRAAEDAIHLDSTQMNVAQMLQTAKIYIEHTNSND